ncbi:MAG TPA: HEAT repeat domain-containing protein [Pyrinomonadaceae bacterium]|nr:HEAT repeat domain-containing protein [Pyrinomonadaceae bacterium]
MKLRRLSATLFTTVALLAATYVAPSLRQARAQGEKEKNTRKTPDTPVAPKAVSDEPEWVSAIPAIAPVRIPEINIDLSHINIDPNINIELPDVNFDMGGDWLDDSIERIEREDLRQTFQLSPGARVELSHVNGSIDVDTHEGNTAELVIKSYSRSANPRKLNVAHTASSLTVRGDARRTGDAIGFDDTYYRVVLKLPRRVELAVDGASGNVRVGELEGRVRLSNVSGNVGVAQATGAAEVSHVSGSVTLRLARLGAGGVRVDNVSGKVSLRFLDEVNADLQTTGNKGKVYVELANVAVQGEMNRSDFRARIGTGGVPVNVSEVTGSVRLARGSTVAEMLAALKTQERMLSRTETARDLTLYIGNRQVRQAFVETLSGEGGGMLKMTAVHALAPYVAEPEVRAAFLKSIEGNSGSGSVVRMTAVRAIGKQYASDKTVRDLFVRLLPTEENQVVRLNIVGALSRYADEANVQRVLGQALKGDRSDIVRMRAASALARRVDDAEIYELLLNAARNDKKTLVRASALGALRSRIKERTELRELFLGYLEHESSILQYRALQGLVELNDPALKARLVERAKDLINMQTRRGWNDRMLLDTLLLLRRLDPQEADRVMEQLGSERMKSY